MTLQKLSTLMGALGLAFLVVVVFLAALNERQTLFHEAQEHAENSALFLADHAQRLFEISDMALRNASLGIGTRDWDSIESSQQLWTSLHDANELLPFVDEIWLDDESGRLRLTTLKFPTPPGNDAEQAIFQRVKEAGDALVISPHFVERLSGKLTFLVARRLSGADGMFRGIASVTLDVSYFTNYWRRLDLPNGEHIAVVRVSDAETDVLAASGDRPDPDADKRGMGSLARDIAGQPVAGAFVPARKTYGFYHRVGSLPLYVTVEFTRASVIAQWHGWMLRLSPLALAAFLALSSILIAGRRQARQEAEVAGQLTAARAALEIANVSLEQRVAARTADLQERNEEIQRFAYIVSHDLRAPLVNIMGFTSEIEGLRPILFGENVDATAPHAQQDFDEAIGFIRSSIDKMDRLIRAILTLSREGQRSFRSERVDTTKLLQTVAEGVAHRIQTVGATITIEPLPDIVTDGIALEQICSNLIDNAVKYLRADRPGRITVTGRRVGDMVALEVADNGRGIDLKDRERVFDLFRRAGPQDQPGEGIGLAHVRALVRRLGGTIALESTPGQGSTFRVILPQHKEKRTLDGVS